MFVPLSEVGGLAWKFHARIIHRQAIGREKTLFPFGNFPVAQFPHNGKQRFTFGVVTQDSDTFFVGGIDVQGKFVKTAAVLVADFQPCRERPQFITRKTKCGGVGIKFVIHLPFIRKGQLPFALADQPFSRNKQFLVLVDVVDFLHFQRVDTDF